MSHATVNRTVSIPASNRQVLKMSASSLDYLGFIGHRVSETPARIQW